MCWGRGEGQDLNSMCSVSVLPGWSEVWGTGFFILRSDQHRSLLVHGSPIKRPHSFHNCSCFQGWAFLRAQDYSPPASPEAGEMHVFTGTMPRTGHSSPCGGEGNTCHLSPVSQVLPDFVMFDCILSFCVCINCHEKPGNVFVGTTSTELRGQWNQLPVSSESLRLQIPWRDSG